MSSLTPLQEAERELSARRLEEVQIREEIDLAQESQLQRLVFMDIHDIARGMGIGVATAFRLRRAARARIREQWEEQEHDEAGLIRLSVSASALGEPAGTGHQGL